MNQFADALLGLLLSWMRSFISNVFSIFSGDSSGMLSWIGRNWLALAVVLACAGALLDFTVYVLRWRPQYVWRTRLRHLRFFGHGREDETFAQGYEQGVEGFEFQDNVARFLQQPQQDVSPEMMPYYSASPVNDAAPIDLYQLPGGSDLPVSRRRRSQKHGKRAYLTEKLRARFPALNEETPPSFPAPPIRAREAFHEPVYPSMTAYPPQKSPEDTADDGFGQ